MLLWSSILMCFLSRKVHQQNKNISVDHSVFTRVYVFVYVFVRCLCVCVNTVSEKEVNQVSGWMPRECGGRH